MYTTAAVHIAYIHKNQLRRLKLITVPFSDQYTDSEAYLSDHYGRSVTPVIVPDAEQHRAATVGAPVGASAGDSSGPAEQRGPGKPPTHMSKDERLAAAELKKLEDQKRYEGPSMGLEGSRLVNEKRRRGFLDDEDFEDIVEDEEPDF